MFIIYKTLRIFVEGRQHIEDLHKENRSVIYSAWHGRQFVTINHLAHQNICVLSSPSRDGRLQAAILTKFGYRIIFGSSKKSPVRALLGMVNELKLNGGDAIMAVDGPTGPIYKAKPGALFLAKKINAAVVPFTYSVENGLILKAWDRYLLPLPFSKCAIIYGHPLRLSQETDEDTIQKETARLEEALHCITRKADNFMNRPDHLSGRHES
jgi:lysophospholipid acyltransferase (LPLAT)-like uncharacterized protein